MNILLKISGLSRSNYYFYVSKEYSDIKNDELMNEVLDIYYKHKVRYGYRRITLELNNRGILVNHKKVLRLMNKMGLHLIIRSKRKYSLYKGTVGKVTDNLIERDFEVSMLNEKCFTDVTEFNIEVKKLYLLPILDVYGRYIVSYNLSSTSSLDEVKLMLE
ncbi:MAG: IS3 family transposase [Erysipelotrichaceae bacterium]|nr:IS3 family transposase [Erysipelotrichaceae bacterium]